MSTHPHAPGGSGLIPLTALTASPDPQEAYRRLRGQHGAITRVELEPGVDAWLVTSWDEICRVVRDDRLFSRNPENWGAWQDKTIAPDSGLGPMMFPRANAYFRDGAEHHRLRQPLDDGISGLDQRAMRESVTGIARGVLTDFSRRGKADLVGEYAALVPLLAVASLFGIDMARGRELQRALVSMFASGAGAQAANQVFEQIIGDVIRAHRQAPAPDLTTAFLQHGNLRDHSEVAQSMVLMISGGYETTVTWIARSLLLMLSDKRFLGRLGGWRPSVDDALEEVLWRDPPMANMPARYALADCEVAGQPVRRGDALILGLAAAGNDPAIHVDDEWTELGNRSYLAWSAGPHGCPAQVPARIITRAAVESALAGLPGLRLDGTDADTAPRPSPWTRCPASIPVIFTPVT